MWCCITEYGMKTDIMPSVPIMHVYLHHKELFKTNQVTTNIQDHAFKMIET